jgi:hypothetical protein
MSTRLSLRLMMAGLASAALLTACSDRPNSNTMLTPNPAPQATGTSGADTMKESVTLTGCLQKGDGRNYILTEINEPNANAVPTDVKGDGSKVEKEQLHAAQHAYRLDADNTDDLDKFVGTQVRVAGTVEKKSDLIAKGTAGADTDSDHDRAKIHEGDLAKVDLKDIQQVAAACGGHPMKSKPRTK